MRLRACIIKRAAKRVLKKKKKERRNWHCEREWLLGREQREGVEFSPYEIHVTFTASRTGCRPLCGCKDAKCIINSDGVSSFSLSLGAKLRARLGCETHLALQRERVRYNLRVYNLVRIFRGNILRIIYDPSRVWKRARPLPGMRTMCARANVIIIKKNVFIYIPEVVVALITAGDKRNCVSLSLLPRF